MNILDTVSFVLDIFIIVVIVLYFLGKIILSTRGKEKVGVDTDQPVLLDTKEDGRLVLRKPLLFYNDGGSCATVMDAICRVQLPYEQYDGIEARGRVEREGAPREDDYFEAVLIQKQGDKNGEDELTIDAVIELRPRKGLSLDDALAEMTGRNVDLAMDFIWMETGRTPWHYRKIRLEISAMELAKLAGVTPKEGEA